MLCNEVCMIYKALHRDFTMKYNLMFMLQMFKLGLKYKYFICISHSNRLTDKKFETDPTQKRKPVVQNLLS